MNFINEQQNLSVGFGDFIQYGFQSFFKFAAVFRTGNQRAHIERIESLILQRFRHITGDNTAGKPFNDSRFADARFTD